MKIAVDGGALCAPADSQYGTYRFSTELLAALSQYGKHHYTVYQFCKPAHACNGNVAYKELQPAFAWMPLRIPLEEVFRPYSVFLGLNQALPCYTKATLIAFSHGLSFLTFPHLYKDGFPRLHKQLQDYTQRAGTIVVSSQRVKEELITFAPSTQNKITVLPFGAPSLSPSVPIKKTKKEPFFLYVGSDQPIKNLNHLLDIFTTFRNMKHYKNVSLVLVGTALNNVPDGVYQYRHNSLDELQEWYSNACAYITVSLYESFNFPVIEALSIGCPVIGYKTALIPEQHPFCHVATEKEDVLEGMKKAIEGSLSEIDTDRVKKRFSWENYVKSLEKLYNRI